MIGFFEYQYLKFKKDHLKNLVALARIDGHVDQSEIEFLHLIGEKYGLKKRQVQNILDSDENYEILVPKGYSQRIGQLYDIVGMMMADNVIDEKEMEFCEHMCDRMQIDKEVIQEMVTIFDRGGVQDFEEWEDFVEKWRMYKLD